MSNLTDNKLNTVIAAADLATITTSITTIVSKLPAVTLSEDQRLSYKAMDVANKIFVEDVINELWISGTGIMPPFITPTIIQNDLTLFNQLDSVEASLLNVLQKISDLKRIASDEALSMANAAYKIYDAANVSGISGAKQAYDKLKTRYTQQSMGRPPIEETPAG